MDTLLVLNNGSFGYGERMIFSGLDFSVSRRDVLCILGANGCGKTTLLRCLNGALKLKTGKVLVDNVDITTMSAVDIARNMGFVFQEHSAPFPFSVVEVVRMGRSPYLPIFGHPSLRDSILAEQALDMVGMLHLKDKPYTQISGGERQLVLIARTLTQEPKIVLMDEPTSHLDFKNQTLVLKMVNMMAENGMTVIMTSHLPNHALQYSNKVVMMNGGNFIASGHPEETMTEERLKETYGINVKIYNADGHVKGKATKYCLATSEPDEAVVSGQPGVETVFQGEARIENGMAHVNIGKDIIIQAVGKQPGKVKISIPSEAIILSRRVKNSAARNVFRGKISAVVQDANSSRLVIDIGHKLDLLISKKSLEDLNPQRGENIYITLKAASVIVD
jgi:iron complex transport system ATP-binding protein